MANAREAEQEASCPSLSNSWRIDRRTSFLKANVSEAFRILTIGHLVAPDYILLAQELSAIPTTNAGLKRLARMTSTIASEAASKLEDAEIDVCKHLDLWKRSSWSESYGKRLSDAAFTIYGIDRDLVYRRANAVMQSSWPVLTKLGLRIDDQVIVAGIVLYPA